MTNPDYFDKVDPDETGEAAERGQQPYVGQLGPDNAQDAEDAGYWDKNKDKDE